MVVARLGHGAPNSPRRIKEQCPTGINNRPCFAQLYRKNGGGGCSRSDSVPFGNLGLMLGLCSFQGCWFNEGSFTHLLKFTRRPTPWVCVKMNIPSTLEPTPPARKKWCLEPGRAKWHEEYSTAFPAPPRASGAAPLKIRNRPTWLVADWECPMQLRHVPSLPTNIAPEICDLQNIIHLLYKVFQRVEI